MTEQRAVAGVGTLVPERMPLLVVDRPETLEGRAVREALRTAGLRALTGFVGVEFPRGAAVGLLLEGEEVRLVDERETTQLRLDRRGLAPEWLDAAVRMKGTMLAVASGARPKEDFPALLAAAANDAVSPPAPAAGLCLEQVLYPPNLYLDPPSNLPSA